MYCQEVAMRHTRVGSSDGPLCESISRARQDRNMYRCRWEGWAVGGFWELRLQFTALEVETGLCIREFTGHDGYVYSVCVSRDGRWMVSGSEDKTVRLWDLTTGRCLRVFTGHTGGIRAVTLSPDGQWLATGSYDNRVIWDDEAKRAGAPSGCRREDAATLAPSHGESV